MKCFPKKKEQGFTLVELLISMAMGLIITTALSSTFLLQNDAYEAQNQIIDVVQTTRTALDMMSREIRMAGYNPQGAAFVFDGITYNSDELRIKADLDGNGALSGNEDITYLHDAETNQIQRKTGSDEFQPFAENIQAFNFEYLDRSGNATTVTEDIRQMRLSITVKSEDITRTYGYQTFTITNRVRPRNLDYPGGMGFAT